MAASIVVVGNINIDFLLQVGELPSAGENVVADQLQMAPGGKGNNQAVAAARLGAEVYLVGRVGKDPFGALLRRNLEREEVDSSFVSVDDSALTGMAFVAVDPKGQNMIFSALGANLNLTPDLVEDALAEIEEVDAILVQLGVPLETVDRVLQIGVDRGCLVVLDPTPLRGELPNLWRYASVVVPNASEAVAMAGLEVKTIASAVEAAMAIYERGVSKVVITLGRNGAVIYDKDGARRIRPYQVQAVDTTGAGDAFAAALTVRLAEGAEFEEAALFASAAAAIACTQVGAQTALPSRKQVEGFLSRRGKRKMLGPAKS